MNWNKPIVLTSKDIFFPWISEVEKHGLNTVKKLEQEVVLQSRV